MPPFEPPNIRQAKNKAWTKVAKGDFRDPNVLWTDYWTRFNTIALPIQDEDAFFADAMAAAQTAQNREHLEEILEQKSRKRRAELSAIVSSIATAALSLRTPLPTPAARSAALKVGQTGSLDSFVQLACGVVFSWNDARRDLRAEPQESCVGGDLKACAQTRDGEPHDTHQDTQDDIHEDAHDDAHDDAHEDAKSDTHEDTHDYIHEDATSDTRNDTQPPVDDPWELENAFPPDLCDVYEASITHEDGTSCRDDNLLRLVEIGDGETTESLPRIARSLHSNNATSTTHAETSPLISSESCPRTISPVPQPESNSDTTRLPSSPFSNEPSLTGTGLLSSQPPSPTTPRTSSSFAPARIVNESPTLLPESLNTTADLPPHTELADKARYATTKRKRSFSLGDDTSHVGNDHRRKCRATG